MGVYKSMCRKKVSSVSLYDLFTLYRAQRKCDEDGVTMKLGWYIPLQDCTPLQDCILVTQMSTADPEHWGCNHNYMRNKYICSLIRPIYIHTRCTCIQCAKVFVH